MPNFSIYFADNNNINSSTIGQPRPIYLDIFTQPGTVYYPMNIEIDVPETYLGSNLPGAKICSVNFVYAGAYSSCIQKDFINNLQNQKITFSNK